LPLKKQIASVAETVLHSYGLLFFSHNRLFGILILLVTFLIPYAGIAGCAGLLCSLLCARAIGFDESLLKTGAYTYSALIFGLGFGTYFEFSMAFWLLLAVGSVFTLLLSAFFFTRLSRNGVPALSIAFICTLWMLLLASQSFSALGLSTRQIYWYNELYKYGGLFLIRAVQAIEGISIHPFLGGFLRSLSGILFQGQLAGGILLALGLLLYSRIALLLMLYGYAIAMGFHSLMGGMAVMGDYYHIGTNYMLVAAALGGFYLIPSWRSFLWIGILVPVTYLLVVALSAILAQIGLPVLSLPFCITVILFLYCLQLRPFGSRLALAPVQHYSPEHNLYHFLHGQSRADAYRYVPLSLPVLGNWMVSQGYAGSMTHKGDWKEALDFVLLDDELKTYRNPGNEPEHFYCYGKPVLAPADGIVEEIADHIEDNSVGGNNTSQNWGNTIVLRHAEGLYTKLSHLKKNSMRVAKGDYVRRGDLLALCGNSGRSPEPHLHFQVQATPFIGSRTLAYPLAAFLQQEAGAAPRLRQYAVPDEGSFVANITANAQLQQAFSFPPGLRLRVEAEGYATELWEVCVSASNERYLWCREHRASAWFIRLPDIFAFTYYYGQRNTLLFAFYQSAYKVLLSSAEPVAVADDLPLTVYGNTPLRWLQDVVAPFWRFLQIRYESRVQPDDDVFGRNPLQIRSRQERRMAGHLQSLREGCISVTEGRLTGFELQSAHKKIYALCYEEQ